MFFVNEHVKVPSARCLTMLHHDIVRKNQIMWNIMNRDFWSERVYILKASIKITIVKMYNLPQK